MAILNVGEFNAVSEELQRERQLTSCDFEIVAETPKAVRIKIDGHSGIKPTTYLLWTSKANLQIEGDRVVAMVGWLLRNIKRTYVVR